MADAHWTASLRRMYAGRAYHNIAHIEHCLAEFAPVKQMCEDPEAVEAAIWFHDAVYVPGRPDNEDRSAELAQQMLMAAGRDEAFARDVASLILATRHAAPADRPDARLLADIDLAILGAEPAEYDAYARAIREEYRHIGDDAYRAGRAAVLGSFLNRERIYQTDHFRQKYESRARANLAREIDRLSGLS